ncbi:MAG: efflux RND transporter permease subunit [Akkermansiaceae bacterium]|jgi:CzcA family heavy metal efflux pump
MLNSIVHNALRFKGLVVLFAAIIMAYGAYLSLHATLDVFPDFVPPQVTIQTEAPGLSANEVESLVTFPIEAAVGGIAGLETTRSESIQGLSVLNVEFKEGTDILIDRQLLTERLTEVAGSLPTQARAPTMSPLVSSTMDLLKIGLISENLTPRELRSLADWTVRPLLKSVPGVAEVNVVGGEAEELQIIPRTEQMRLLGVTLSEISAAASGAIGIRGAGYIETANQRLTIHANTPPSNPETIGKVTVRGEGGDAILLRDVAEVKVGAMPKFGDAMVNGKVGVILVMTSQAGANTLTTTQAVEQALEELKPIFESQGVTLFDRLHRPANFIEVALHHLTESLLIGGVLVGVVLLIFLANFRTAFISFVSIPLSLLSAVVVMHFAGITLDTMTLGGLAVAVGVVVDDAIIDVENILRRLRDNATRGKKIPAMKVILDASMEVRGSVIYATLIVLAVFLPVFALSGLQGKFFEPLAVGFILAVVASLVVAMTVTPALCLLFLSKSQGGQDPFYIGWMKSLHRVFLGTICRFPLTAMLLGAVSVGYAGVLLKGLETELLPPFREGHFVVQVIGTPGTSLEETMRFGKKVSDELLAIPEIATVEMQAGRSEKGVDTWGPESCEFHIDLKPDPGTDEAAVQEQIRGIMESYSNRETETLTFLGDRISESLSGETSSVVISLFGKDLDVLDSAANRVRAAVSATEGAIDVQALGTARAPGINIELEMDRLQTVGLRPVEVLDMIQTAFQGTEIAQIYDGDRIIPVNVRVGEDARSKLPSVQNLMISTASGGMVPLGDLGRIYLDDERASISHETGRRRQVVTANVSGRSVSSFVEEVRKKLADEKILTDGVYAIFGGTAEAEATTHRELMGATSITLLCIGIFLSMVVRRPSHLVLVISILPFAVAGGVYAIVLSGLPLSLGALVGFITLLGLSIRNAIMLMTHYEHLVVEEGFEWNLATVIQGARERVVPVVMTTAVTGLALLPLALSPTSAGREIEGPMAIVILGGLISSTLVTLLLLPAAANRFAGFKMKSESLG